MDLSQLQHDPSGIFQWRLDGTETMRCEGWMEPFVGAMNAACLRLLHGTPEDAPLRCFAEWPRGHGKTALLAGYACWLLLCSKRPITGLCCAADQDQARLLADAMALLVRQNAELNMLDVQVSKVKNRTSGSTLHIMSSDTASSYGVSPSFVILDELAHWAANAESLWHSLLSSAAKRPRCLLCCITNAGFATTWQWPLRETIRSHADWFFDRLEGPRASWIAARALSEQRSLLPDLVYRRLWCNEWSSGAGDALRPDEIERSIRLPGPATEMADGWIYGCGVDLGVRFDHSAVCVVRKHVGSVREIERPQRLTARQEMLIDAGVMEAPLPETESIVEAATGQLQLGEVLSWQPPAGGSVDLNLVQQAVLKLHQRYRFAVVAYDPWQCEMLARNLALEGLPVCAYPFMSKNLQTMTQELLSSFQTGSISLWREPQLLDDLASAQIEERSYGYRLTFPRSRSGGHGDRATALCLALLGLKNAERSLTYVQGDLLCAPC